MSVYCRPVSSLCRLGARIPVWQPLTPSALRSYELHLDFELHFVRDQYAPGLDHLVPLEAPFPAVDLPGRREARALLSPRIFAAPLECAVECHRHRRVANR